MKREAPAATRNVEALAAVLVPLLEDRAGDLLEVGSGTGQHAVQLAARLPGLTWWPTDPGAEQLASIRAWREEAGPANLRPPQALDASRWPWTLPDAPPQWQAIFSANVIHISPWAVAEGLFRGAAAHLADDGLLLFYGPFRRHGEHNAPSNAAFDERLRGEDPRWGVRDLTDLDAEAARHGLHRARLIEMPANNAVLAFTRQPRSPT